MFELIIVLAIYTGIILFFVPLERIGKVQTHLRDKVNKHVKKD